MTKLYYNLAYKPPKQKILHLYYDFNKEYTENKNKTHIALIERRSDKKLSNKNLPVKPEGNYQHENKEMKKTKNIDQSNNTYKEMKKKKKKKKKKKNRPLQ